MGLTEQQREARRAFIGGTDMAALAGLSRYATPIEVYRDKVGEAPERQATAMMNLGTVLEPAVASLFEAATHLRTRRHTAPLIDRMRPWLGGHIDRYAITTPEAVLDGRLLAGGILECKWAMSRDGWGATGSADVPPGYAVQVQHYLGITGRPVAYMAALLGYADFRWYEIPRDDETITMLREIAHQFWHENVLAHVPPEPDGSEAYGRYLAERYREDRGAELVATPAQQAYGRDLRQAENLRKRAADAEATARQRLQASMGEASRLLLPDGTITWRAYQQSSVDWQAVAADLAGYLEPEHADIRRAQIVARHTTTESRRPFRPTWNEESTDDA